MKTLMMLLLVLLVAAMPFAGSLQPVLHSVQTTAPHIQVGTYSDDECPMGDDMDGCPMEDDDMEGCDMDGMDDMMDDCHGEGGMMGLTVPSTWGFQFRLFLASLGIL